jgi:hypothetical protein
VPIFLMIIMENKTYPENVTAFLNEIKDSIDEPKEIAGVLYIPARKEIADHFDNFVSLRNRAFSLAERLALKPFVALSFVNPVNKIGFQLELSKLNKVATTTSTCNNLIDLEKEHVERLNMAFQKVSVDHIAESVKFLSDHGWTDARFMKTFNISSVTLWRYKNRKAPVQQANQVENGQSTEKESLTPEPS